MSERTVSIDLPEKIIQEKILYPNGCLLLITEGCPAEIASRLKTEVCENGTDWFQKHIVSKDITPSTRTIYYSNLGVSQRPLVVLKEKHLREDPGWVKNSFYTTSLTHEMRTSMALAQIIKNFPEEYSIEHNNQILPVNLKVQAPLGAVINTKERKSYGIFQYEEGESIRDRFEWWGTWNNAPEELRKLTGQIQRALNVVAVEALKRGLEPWDLGAHQVVYRLENNKLNLYILDTEEYDFGFDQRFGPEEFLGLPPSLIYLYLGIL